MVLDVTGFHGTEIAEADYTTLDGGANHDSLTIRLTTSQMEALKLELASQSGFLLNDKGELIGNAQSAFIGNQYTTLDSIGITVKSWETVKFEVCEDPNLNDAAVLTGTQATLAAGTEDTTYTINASDLLAGFSDVDGDTLSVSALTANHGSLVENNDGTWTFTPAGDYNGPVSLSYNVIDSHGGSLAATQSFSLAAVNDAPVLTGTQATLAAGTEDTTYMINASDLLAGFSDVDGDTLSVSALTANHGSLVENNDGTWTFTPAGDYNGPVSLSYNVIDSHGGSLAATQSFSLAAMNDAPTDIRWNATDWTGGVALPGANAVLANLTTVDPDNDSGFTYSLQSSNSPFLVSEDGTVTRVSQLFNNTTYMLNVKVTDDDGAFHTETFNIITGSDNSDTPTSTNPPSNMSDPNAPAVVGDDVLYGDSGSDVIFAGSGDDTVFGQDGMDTVWGGAGNDVLNGGHNFDTLNGEAGNDTLRGDSGSDTLNGGDGNDTLTGGSLDDDFVFNTALGDTNVDTIIDFTNGATGVNNDKFSLDNAVFTAFASTGAMSSSAFASNDTGLAGDSTDRIIYNSATGALNYDADGAGGVDAVQFAQLEGGPLLTNNDFFII